MMLGYRLRLGPLATPIRHCMAMVALFAQCLMVIAPLADAREAAPSPPSIASIFEMGTSGRAVDTDHEHQSHHDSSTCPACIAQSLVAQVTSGTRVPAPVSDERIGSERTHERAFEQQYLTLQRSRAPPIAS